jgi:hypothetical protein
MGMLFLNKLFSIFVKGSMVLHKRGMKVETNVWDVNKQNIVNWDVVRE